MKVSKAARQTLLRLDRHRCAYCLSPDFLSGQSLTVDHIVPTSAGGSDDVANLCLACRTCNESKGARVVGYDAHSAETVPLFNPRTQTWSDHFAWSASGALIEAKSPTGRITIDLLNMNNLLVVKARTRWVSVGWHPPS